MSSFRTFLRLIYLLCMCTKRSDETFRDAKVYHIGLFREKISLQPVECEHMITLHPCHVADRCISDYSKLPSGVTVDVCYLLDPLIATGGTACAALTMLVDWGLPSQCLLTYCCLELSLICV